MNAKINTASELLEFVNKYAGALTICFTVLSFCIAYVQAIIFTHGQTELVNYVIAQVGIAQLWTNALVVVVGAAIGSMASYLMVKYSGDLLKPLGLTGALLFFIIAWQILPLGVALVLFTLPALTLILKPIVKMHVKSINIVRANVLRYQFLLFVSVGIYSYPTFPLHSVHFTNGQTTTVTILAEKDDYIIVADKLTPMLKEIPTKNIASLQLCQAKKSWYSFTLTDMLIPSSRLLDSCKENQKH